MGFPKLIGWFKYQSKLNHIFFKTNKLKNNIKFNVICFNLNNIIYEIYDNIFNKNIDNIEDIIINNTIKYLTEIMNTYNKSYIFIALDGIPSYQKITQQRIKRYNIYYRHLKDDNKKNKWNALNKILPGTNFIIKLDNKIMEFINNNNDKKILYSSYNKDGESVYKIIQYIKKYCKNKNNILIYGCDSDTILLSLINSLLYNNNIYIFNKEYYYNIYELKNVLYKIFNNFNSIINFIIIYILINFHNIHFYDIDTIINITKEINKPLLYKDNDENIYKINNKILLIVMTKLNNEELKLCKNYNNLMNKSYFEKLMLNPKIKDKIEEVYNIRIKQNDYDKFKDFINDNNILINYKKDYYNYYNINQIEDLCDSYLYGFYWLINYNFSCELKDDLSSNCPDWTWYYPYYCSPFMSDLYKYFKNNYENIEFIISNNNDKNKSFNHQLIYIIPFEYLKNINNETSLLYKQIYNNKNFVFDIPLIDYEVLKSIIK